ncbi:MAG: Uma2 family endonuclease [Betaproteobacteria bacterium]|nr:Uma2 family endonuclease [Betaproteobacteria bacterium]
MGLPAARPATYEDLFDLPENLVGEIIGGRLVTHPRPAPKHARAYYTLGFKVGGAYDDGVNGPGGWWILDEPELHLARDILVPDLAGWRRERMPRLPETAWFELPPDWVCEILSPSTAKVDRAEKLPIYAAHGVRHAWLVDPDLRTLEVFENHDGRWLLLTVLENDAAVSQPPFDAIAFSLSGLWAD